MTLSHLDGALKWWDSGMSVVTVLADGSKRPMGSWRNYQQARASRERVEQWFNSAPGQGVGIICGAVSENLEMLEIESARMGSEYLDKVQDAMVQTGADGAWQWLLNTGYVESTPSGGIHILYRITDQPVPGNTKIALSENGKITYAETRGEGGFVVVAPSGGRVHKSGDSWSVIAGQIGEVPGLEWATRCAIHEALRIALDERVLPTYERPAGAVTAYDRSQGDRPGDAFNSDPAVTIHDILTRNGWKYLGKSRGQDRYVHPYSSDMTTHSAVTGHNGSPNLYAWSGLPAEDYYTKFGLLAHLEFNGDFSAAGKFLYGQGYGERREVDISDWDIPTSGHEATGVGPVVDSSTPGVGEAAKPAKLRLTEWTETGVGELLAKVYGAGFRAVPEQKLWRVYRDGLWHHDRNGEVGIVAKRVTTVLLSQAREMVSEAKAAEDEEKTKIANGVLRKAESFRSDRGARAVINCFGREEGITVPFSAFDVDLDVLRFTNGTLDLRTLELREHRASDMITLDIPFEYDPDAKAPTFRKFMDETLPDAEVRKYMQRAQGYALAGRPNEGVWFALWGDTGCGKSTYLDIVRNALGDHARTAAQATFAQRNEGSRAANDLNDIRMARMVTISETKEGQLFNESLIKQYSGGDEMNSHGLYQENGTWKNRGVLFMATNHPPRLSADDNANWRRIKMIEFPVSRYTNPDMVADPKLASKIVAAELPGVMNWIIEGLRAYREVGLVEPGVVTEAVRAQRTDSDQVAQFLTEGEQDGYITVDESAEISQTQLYDLFQTWCRNNGLTPLGSRRFGMSLTSKRFDTVRTAKTRSRKGIGVGVRGVRGTIDANW